MLKDLKLFECWYEHGDVALTYDELAKLVSCDAMLIGRSSSGDWGKFCYFSGIRCLNVGAGQNTLTNGS